MKEKILALRAQGRTYSQIAAELNVSKGLISYHCGTGQKVKTNQRKIVQRKISHPIVRKWERFRLDFRRLRTVNKMLYRKLVGFCRETTGRFTGDMAAFSVADLLAKFGDSPVCALTGRAIDLLDGPSYALDHIIPRAKGGTNTLDNCQLVCAAANQAKHDMFQEDFIKLCEDIVAHAQRQRSPQPPSPGAPDERF